MSINLMPVNEGGVRLEVKENTLSIAGNITTPDPGNFMDPFLEELHRLLTERNVKILNMDVTNLTFLNSAGIRSLVDWILLLEELPEEKKYSIRILYNSKHLWQESSMSTLVYLNPAFVSKDKV